MFDCKCLIHPFQNDPGTSQSQRVMEELLSGAAKIDARTLADLLHYFVQLSRHINYYDFNLNVSDWQPFFQKSIPFILASAINYKQQQTEEDFAFYNSLFEKKPSSSGLQLQAYFIFYHFINKINSWHKAVAESGLPIEKEMELIIKDKLQQPVKNFIAYTNAAVKWYGIQRIDFLKFYENKVWNLDLTDLYSVDNSFRKATPNKYKQLNNLYDNFKNIYPAFLNAVKILSASAENNLELSLLPLKADLQKKHPPHLGLLFAFLNMFRQLQNDLNGFTRKHLDFFYKDVLQIKARGAVADKTHVLFEIQKQLEKYLIKKGTLVKDGKDNNKQDILFSLDDEIVVNKTEVAEVRTLFLNNQTAHTQTYVEGVYIAPDATKANGVDKDFTDDEPKNFYTVGNNLSKYTNPETKIIQPYPNARIGFILASPVLYLHEGTRTVDITLACKTDDVCKNQDQSFATSVDVCCDKKNQTVAGENEDLPDFIGSDKLFDVVKKMLTASWYVISEDLIQQALKRGITESITNKIRNIFLIDNCKTNTCCAAKHFYKNKISVKQTRWLKFLNNPYLSAGDKAILADIFKPSSVFKIVFSGEKAWLEPTTPAAVSITGSSTNFILLISSTLNPDKPAVTFYNKDNLKEDFGTSQPLVKIELNGDIQIVLNKKLRKKLGLEGTGKDCCLFTDIKNCEQYISLYHFFRNVEVLNNAATKIDVTVCGLKNFIVQNDESLQDVNGIILPFGSIPKTGSNFYIGCPEIFCKNWSQFNLKFNWKDKPASLKDYYHGYEDFLSNIKDDDFDESRFVFEYSFLENGEWKPVYSSLPTFNSVPNPAIPATTPPIPPTPFAFHLLFDSDALLFCSIDSYNQVYNFSRSNFNLGAYVPGNLDCFKNSSFTNNSKNGFLKLTLLNQDFQHSRYSFVLTRQMMALGKWPEIYVGPVYDGIPNPPPTTTLPVLNVDEVFDAIFRSYEFSTNIRNRLDNILSAIFTALPNPVNPETITFSVTDLKNCISSLLIQGSAAPAIPPIPIPFPPYPNPLPNPISPDAHELDQFLLQEIIDKLEDSVLFPVYDKLRQMQNTRVVIPNQPYTPQVKGISLDYKATARLEDIDLIHLYPYDGTYKHEEIELQPTLVPTFCDEGTLFLGLKQLVPGNNLNILFQLAEATSDSESEKEIVHWYYLDNNVWKPLRTGFEVLDDATENLTASGIIKFAMPANMASDNTIMPKDLYWIKATIAQNSKAVSETIGIHPQAILVTFTNDEANDKLRLSQPLAAQSISKLNEADANVKSVQQPYDSFDGRIPEMEGQFYVRVSELLRHKGRAIQKFDYERLALEAFPQLFKAKCINHSFALDAHTYTNDFPYAPGYIILAVIPDLNKLKAGNSFEPKVSVSIIEKIEAYIRSRTSPFVRFRAMNPRYEKINFCLRIKLMPGKDENYYREKLKEDLSEFLAPWAVGEYDKLTFGQCVYRSDIIRFLETRDYVDYINDFRMAKESQVPLDTYSTLCPDTPRSILIAGEIEVCIEPPACEDWGECYDDSQNKIDCCKTKLIAVADYCEDKINRVK